jgi:thiol-disulfide isomerase/thioredoxin
MNKYKNILIVLFTIFALSISSLTYSQIKFTEVKDSSDWRELLQQASADEKLIFLDIYATWCGPCKYIDQNVYPQPEVGDVFNKYYYNVKIDGESQFGRSLVQKFGLTAYPTMYFLSSKEDVITRIVGVREAPELSNLGNAVALNAEKLKDYFLKYKDGNLSAEELMDYHTLLVSIEELEKAAEISAQILPSLSDEDILDPKFKDIILNSSFGMDSKVYKLLKENKSAFEENWSDEELAGLFAGIYNVVLTEAIINKDGDVVEKIVHEFLPVYLADNPQDIKDAVYVTRKLYFANTENWTDFINTVNHEFETNHADDPAFLYGEAYEVASEYNSSQEALGAALGWMKQALNLDKTFDNYVMISYISGMSGLYDDARAYVAQASEMELSDEQKSILDELTALIDQAEDGAF